MQHFSSCDSNISSQVNVSFDIVALQDFDEVEEKFSAVGILYIYWIDEQIRWNPANYGGIFTQMYQLSDVWYPVLILCNPYESVRDVGAKWMTVRYYANGFAVYAPGAVFEATCSVDVTYYPFDTQVNLGVLIHFFGRQLCQNCIVSFLKQGVLSKRVYTKRKEFFLQT